MKQADWNVDQWPVLGLIIILIVCFGASNLIFQAEIDSLREELKSIKSKINVEKKE